MEWKGEHFVEEKKLCRAVFQKPRRVSKRKDNKLKKKWQER